MQSGSTNHRSISSYLCSPNQHQDNTRFSQGLSSPARHNGLLNGLGSPYARSLPEYHECLTSRPPVNSPSPILCPDGVNSHAFDYNGKSKSLNPVNSFFSYNPRLNTYFRTWRASKPQLEQWDSVCSAVVKLPVHAQLSSFTIPGPWAHYEWPVSSNGPSFYSGLSPFGKQPWPYSVGPAGGRATVYFTRKPSGAFLSGIWACSPLLSSAEKKSIDSTTFAV